MLVAQPRFEQAGSRPDGRKPTSPAFPVQEPYPNSVLPELNASQFKTLPRPHGNSLRLPELGTQRADSKWANAWHFLICGNLAGHLVIFCPWECAPRCSRIPGKTRSITASGRCSCESMMHFHSCSWFPHGRPAIWSHSGSHRLEAPCMRNFHEKSSNFLFGTGQFPQVMAPLSHQLNERSS